MPGGLEGAPVGLFGFSVGSVGWSSLFPPDGAFGGPQDGGGRVGCPPGTGHSLSTGGLDGTTGASVGSIGVSDGSSMGGTSPSSSSFWKQCPKLQSKAQTGKHHF